MTPLSVIRSETLRHESAQFTMCRPGSPVSQPGGYRQADNGDQQAEANDRCGPPLQKGTFPAAVEEGGEQDNAESESRQEHGTHKGPPAGKVLGELVKEQEVPFRPWAELRGKVDLPADGWREQDGQKQHRFDREQRDHRHFEEVIGKERFLVVRCLHRDVVLLSP